MQTALASIHKTLALAVPKRKSIWERFPLLFWQEAYRLFHYYHGALLKEEDQAFVEKIYHEIEKFCLFEKQSSTEKFPKILQAIPQFLTEWTWAIEDNSNTHFSQAAVENFMSSHGLKVADRFILGKLRLALSSHLNITEFSAVTALTQLESEIHKQEAALGTQGFILAHKLSFDTQDNSKIRVIFYCAN